MTGLEIFLIIIGILILIAIVIVVILVVTGVFVENRISKLLTGPFSMYSSLDSSRYATNINDILTLSSSTSVNCTDYSWLFDNNFLKQGDKIAIAESKTPGSQIKVEENKATGSGPANGGATTDLNQWVYNEREFTWCLQSDPNLCMFNDGTKITLEGKSLNTGFIWTLTDALKSPSCQ